MRALVRPGMVVLDAGAGTGVLAMLAARRGARVHAVESMPVAELARELCSANGLADRITIHRADLCALAPVEPVDLVIGDWLGCFLVDDRMLPAVAAAGRWLRPGGRFAPARVGLQLAPVGNLTISSLDVFASPFYGLDLSAAVAWGTRSCYLASLGPDTLLAAPVAYHDFVPPGPPSPFDRTLRFILGRAGCLRALAGWFVADLAPGVTLSTAPGIDTHWGQHLFTLPEVAVAAGDSVTVRLWLDEAEDLWRWQGEVVRRGHPALAFDLCSDEWHGRA